MIMTIKENTELYSTWLSVFSSLLIDETESRIKRSSNESEFAKDDDFAIGSVAFAFISCNFRYHLFVNLLPVCWQNFDAFEL